MNERIAFTGHRYIWDSELRDKLKSVIIEETKSGNKFFTMGTHGDFDKLALSVCREVRKDFPDIEIEVVITSINAIQQEKYFGKIITNYDDVKTVMYDIEETYFKRQIIESNRQMIDNCNTLICFVNKKRYSSGAKLTMNYAKRKGLRIINLFENEKR